MKAEDLKKIYEFTILYSGWDCDGKGWVAEDENGKRHLILTSHGSEYVAEASELEENIKYYREVIAETEKALAMLGEKE